MMNKPHNKALGLQFYGSLLKSEQINPHEVIDYVQSIKSVRKLVDEELYALIETIDEIIKSDLVAANSNPANKPALQIINQRQALKNLADQLFIAAQNLETIKPDYFQVNKQLSNRIEVKN